MKPPDLSIFRLSALERYRQRRMEHVTPRLLATPVFLFCWLLLALLLLGEFLTWEMDVPMYIDSLGITTSHNKIVLFVPPSAAQGIHKGATALVRLEDGSPLTCSVASVTPAPLDPAEVARLYSFSDSTLRQPVSTIDVHPPAHVSLYPAQHVQGQVESGRHNVFSLLFQSGR